MTVHVQKGDTVEVISGNQRGQRGKVLRVLSQEGRVVVEGVNARKRHRRATNETEGGIITFEAPLSASNVQPVCPHCDRPVRTRHRRDADGTRERLCAKCGNPIPKA
ncbi:MAG: 50S ribosomal protein L24 [Gemmatimonadota bacterium]